MKMMVCWNVMIDALIFVDNQRGMDAGTAAGGPKSRVSISADLWVMVRPRAAFAALFARPGDRRGWSFLRRPAYVALVLGCTISLLTVRSLNARLVLSSMAAWAFVPLFEIASLRMVWRAPPATLHFRAAIDRFFTGHAAWSLWLIAFGACWSSVPDGSAVQPAFWLWQASACAILLWSVYVDLCFFRCVSATPGRDLLAQRAISWVLIVAVWGGGILPAYVLGTLRP
jgi:hypothetical protein